MTANPELDTDLLADCVRRHLPASRVQLRRIPTGKFNTGYFVDADDRELVLRVAPPKDAVFLFYEVDMMRQEPELHRILRRRTTVPVAELIAYDDSCDQIDRDFILMQRLPGSALSGTPLRDTERVMRQVGECLAQAHAITADTYGYIGAHRPMEPQPAWLDAFRIMWAKLLDNVGRTGHYDADECRGLATLLDAHAALFDRDVPASLLHMDVWAQNILVDGDGELTGLVDWDRALWGDPEIEFAVLDYCGISTPGFWRGYGTPRDESPDARIRNVFYLLYELQKYIVIRHGRSHDPAGAEGYKRQAMGIVRQAFG
jgi:aminoglycoside phosphotransferase (APT) family kinase protein